MSGEEDASQTNKANAATEKVVDVLSDNKGSDWKKTLSGALDEERLLCALVVLCIFYIGLTLANAYHENHNKDEDAITKNCACRSEHRQFYIAWSAICYALWFVCHSLVLLHNNPKVSRYIKKFLIMLLKYFFCYCNKKWCLFISCENKCNKHAVTSLFQTCFCIKRVNSDDNSHQWKWKCCRCIPISKTQGSLDMESARQKDNLKSHHKKIDQYVYHLWTQYYELYVVGITKNKYGLKQVGEIIAKAHERNPEQNEKSRAITRYISTTSATASLVYHKAPEPTEGNPNDSTDIQSSEQGTITALPHHTTQVISFYFQVFLHVILAFI